EFIKARILSPLTSFRRADAFLPAFAFRIPAFNDLPCPRAGIHLSFIYPTFLSRRSGTTPTESIMHARRLLTAGIVFAAFAFLTFLSSNPTLALAGDAMDWPNWRGPEQNRISRETGLIDEWDPESGENVLWKSEEAAGISCPIVMNGKV